METAELQGSGMDEHKLKAGHDEKPPTQRNVAARRNSEQANTHYKTYTNIRHATYNIQHTTYNVYIQHATNTMQLS